MSDPVTPSDEVRTARVARRPVVALETSVLGQGLPDPWNRRAAQAMDRAVRELGAIPAWTWIADGSVRVGATPEDLEALMDGAPAKVARRDLPMAVATGRLGATTVSATLWVAHRAGIEVAATGGIGGVHPGTGDVSADLVELSRTPGTLVCSGPKSILDPAATLERLEELGVAVLGYRTGRLPFFIVRDAGLDLEHGADGPEDVAAAAATRRSLGVDSTLLVTNPCPAEAALDGARVAEAVARCLDRAPGPAGKEVTPALLACLAEETDGDSLAANLALLESNARLAAEVAAALG
ncbi:MAG TPA: pseudouridine-5'-phosphate glycosidase [Actinomycetota bacterium]|nr:pseudouridine-5'-phosphate glycosidase [Actinomycetota bacterium]